MRDLFQVVFELKQKEIDDAYKKMDKDKRVKINLYTSIIFFFQLGFAGFTHRGLSNNRSFLLCSELKWQK